MVAIRSSRILLWAVTFVALCVGASTRATAEDAAAYYKGKTVRIIVGFGPGGGYDTYSRMLAPHLAKVLDADVIVENQPGAGGISALNRLYRAPPDGLKMMLIQGTGAALQQLLGQSAVRFDLTKVGYLGIVSASPWMWLVTPKSKIRTPADAMKPGVVLSWPGTGQIDGLSDGAAITCYALKLHCKIVMGYKGSHAAALALAQGEMDAMYVSDSSANNYVKAGDARAIATMARDKSRFFPKVPTIFSLFKLTPDQQWWFDFRATADALGRILIVPPGLPHDRLAFLQAAAKKVLTDPKVIAEGDKRQRYIQYAGPEKTRKMVLNVITAPTPAQKKKVSEVILHK